MLILKTVYGQIVSTLKGISITIYIQILKPLFEQSLDIVSNLKKYFNILVNDRNSPLNTQAIEMNIILYFHGKENS